MKTQSYRISKTGSINNLHLVTEDLPKPVNSEVCLKIKSIGLNFADVFTIQGLYKASPNKDFIPGLEFSGEIIDKGDKANNFDINDKVIGVVRFGSFTSHLNIDQSYLIKLPENWTYEEGAGFIVQALTAYYALIPLGNLSEKQTVLIHSAAGGVGIYANRIAKKYSAYTIGTVGDSSKIDLLSSEGYDEILVRTKNFKEDLKKKLNGRVLDLILQAVGGKVEKESFDLLATTGRMVAYGLSDFAPHGSSPNYIKLAYKYLTRPRYDTLQLIESNKSILGFNLIWLYDRVEFLRKMLLEIQSLNLEKPYIGSVYKFEELKKAIKFFQTGKTKGKVIIKVD